MPTLNIGAAKDNIKLEPVPTRDFFDMHRHDERRKPFKREPYPSETQDRFLVRFPEGMRAKIAELSKANNRSMNAEIIARLQASLDLSERGTGSKKMTFKIGDDGFAQLRPCSRRNKRS